MGTGPVHGGLGTLEHGGDASMTRVEVLNNLLPQAVGNDWAVVQQDYRARDNQGMAVLVVGFDVIIPISNVFRDTSGHSVVEELVHRGGPAGSFQSLPGDDGDVRVGQSTQGAGVVAIGEVGTMVQGS